MSGYTPYYGADEHPLVYGLLQELPEPRTKWTTEDRKKWLEMASTIFNVIYKDSDDGRGSLKVVVEIHDGCANERDSA